MFIVKNNHLALSNNLKRPDAQILQSLTKRKEFQEPFEYGINDDQISSSNTVATHGKNGFVYINPNIQNYSIQYYLNITHQNKTMPYSRKYAVITLKKRQDLIDLVIEKGKSINQAGKELNIKSSTAKLIFSKYKRTGKFTIKKNKKFQQETTQVRTTQASSSQVAQNQLILPIASYSPMMPEWPWNYYLTYEWTDMNGLTFPVCFAPHYY